MLHLKETSGRLFFYFREILEKIFRIYYKKKLDSFQVDLEFFSIKWYLIDKLDHFFAHFGGLPDDQGGIICMILILS